MRKNRIILSLGVLCVLSCNRAGSHVDEKQLEMVRSTNIDTIKAAIDTLDNLIEKSDEKDLGRYYYERGFALMKAAKLKEANRDLKKAKSLGYLPEECEKLIQLNNSLQDIEKEF